VTRDFAKECDVVVLRSPEDGHVLLKRVVGVPGDRIEVRNGRILLDGAAYEIREGIDEMRERLGGRWHDVRLDHGGGSDLEPIQLPEGRYLVMGDNRGQSHDGREFGLVERGSIQGRAIAIYWRNGFIWRPL
jgi:signal peptidase I